MDSRIRISIVNNYHSKELYSPEKQMKCEDMSDSVITLQNFNIGY